MKTDAPVSYEEFTRAIAEMCEEMELVKATMSGEALHEFGDRMRKKLLDMVKKAKEAGEGQ